MPAKTSVPSAQRQCRSFGVGHSAIDAMETAYAIRDAGTACSAISIPLPGGSIKTIIRSIDGEQLLYCEVSAADTQQILDVIGPHRDVSTHAQTLCADGLMLDEALATLHMLS